MDEHGGVWASAREDARLRREVLSKVRRASRGDDVHQVAERLDREFAAAGIPQPPELVHMSAVGIASGRWPGLAFAGPLLDFVVHQRVPPGFRSESRYLPRDRWVPVTLAETVMARAALSRSLRVQRWLADHWGGEGPVPFTGSAVRLIAMAGTTDQVAALLGGVFAGILPVELSPELLAAIAEAKAADEHLMAHARLGEDSHGYMLEVAVPQQR
jgi:hypothetical protein